MDLIDEPSDPFVDASLAFHTALADLSENQSLALVVGSLKVLWDSHALRVESMEGERFSRDDRRADVNAHEAVTAAIRKRGHGQGPAHPRGSHGSGPRVLVPCRGPEPDRRHERGPRGASRRCNAATGGQGVLIPPVGASGITGLAFEWLYGGGLLFEPGKKGART